MAQLGALCISNLCATKLALNIRADGHPLPKAFFDAGVLVNSSSDYPVREFFPMTRIATGVKSGVALNTMLNSHTIQGAEAMFTEKRNRFN
ncbi:hypothetical protein [Acinetobacter indicus]|uniref:hypothetical protein n=1 Tax=Acinetobacter indicus TaxID=756892 RepID=UPI00209B76DF|nr:hypothetical protein [Acinetobacter indicus]MCO8098962.1 hypothetical protein [Acinetobacter indicus]MCO8104683.1 hypothetical protein [Acinetobacter indicus]